MPKTQSWPVQLAELLNQLLRCSGSRQPCPLSAWRAPPGAGGSARRPLRRRPEQFFRDTVRVNSTSNACFRGDARIALAHHLAAAGLSNPADQAQLGDFPAPFTPTKPMRRPASLPGDIPQHSPVGFKALIHGSRRKHRKGTSGDLCFHIPARDPSSAAGRSLLHSGLEFIRRGCHAGQKRLEQWRLGGAQVGAASVTGCFFQLAQGDRASTAAASAGLRQPGSIASRCSLLDFLQQADGEALEPASGLDQPLLGVVIEGGECSLKQL